MKTKSKFTAFLLVLIMLLTCAMPALVGIGVKANASTDGYFNSYPDDFYDDELVLPKDKSEIKFPSEYENIGWKPEGNPYLYYFSDTTDLALSESIMYEVYSYYYINFYWEFDEFYLLLLSMMGKFQPYSFIFLQANYHMFDTPVIDILGELRNKGHEVIFIDNFEEDRLEGEGSDIESGADYIDQRTSYYQNHSKMDEFLDHVVERIMERPNQRRMVVFGQSMQKESYLKMFVLALLKYFEIPKDMYEDPKFSWEEFFESLNIEFVYHLGGRNFVNLTTGEKLEEDEDYPDLSDYTRFVERMGFPPVYGITLSDELDQVFKFLQRKEIYGKADAILIQNFDGQSYYYDPDAPEKDAWGTTRETYTMDLFDILYSLLQKWHKAHDPEEA